jgi:hypothetical protein
LILDIYFPEDSSDEYRALIQIDDLDNRGDADFFVGSNNGIGVRQQYPGEIQPDRWHRIGFVVDQSAAVNRIDKYIDGGFVGDQEADEVDGRWALRSGAGAILFGDDSGEVEVGYVNSIQLRAELLSAEEMANLGGAQAAGVPWDDSGAEQIVITEASVVAGQLVLAWEGGAGPYRVERKADLKDPAWTEFATTSEQTLSTRIEGSAAFFRVSRSDFFQRKAVAVP